MIVCCYYRLKAEWWIASNGFGSIHQQLLILCGKQVFLLATNRALYNIPSYLFYQMELAEEAILGQRSAASLATGPVIPDPFISPLGLTMTPALSTFQSKTGQSYPRSRDTLRSCVSSSFSV